MAEVDADEGVTNLLLPRGDISDSEVIQLRNEPTEYSCSAIGPFHIHFTINGIQQKDSYSSALPEQSGVSEIHRTTDSFPEKTRESHRRWAT